MGVPSVIDIEYYSYFGKSRVQIRFLKGDLEIGVSIDNEWIFEKRHFISGRCYWIYCNLVLGGIHKQRAIVIGCLGYRKWFEIWYVLSRIIGPKFFLIPSRRIVPNFLSSLKRVSRLWIRDWAQFKLRVGASENLYAGLLIVIFEEAQNIAVGLRIFASVVLNLVVKWILLFLFNGGNLCH